MNRTTLATLCASLLLLTGAAAQAQTLYRSVGPDGRVTFSDTPPPNATNKAAGSTAGSGPANAGAALPYELQQTVNRYPVTLYTSDSCAPCASGRNLLTARGIPFSERMVSTAEDVAALQRLAGDASLPLLTIGSQQISGFSDADWMQYLDAAGYPKASQLPTAYRQAPATPFVAVQRAPNTPAPPSGSAAQGSARPAIETVNTRPRPAPAQTPNPNPAGIRF